MGKFSNGGLVELYKKIGLRDPKFFNGKSVVNLFKILGIEPEMKEDGTRLLTPYEILGVLPKFSHGEEKPIVFAIKNRVLKIGKYEGQTTSFIYKKQKVREEKTTIQTLKERYRAAIFSGDDNEAESCLNMLESLSGDEARAFKDAFYNYTKFYKRMKRQLLIDLFAHFFLMYVQTKSKLIKNGIIRKNKLYRPYREKVRVEYQDSVYGSDFEPINFAPQIDPIAFGLQNVKKVVVSNKESENLAEFEISSKGVRVKTNPNFGKDLPQDSSSKIEEEKPLQQVQHEVEKVDIEHEQPSSGLLKSFLKRKRKKLFRKTSGMLPTCVRDETEEEKVPFSKKEKIFSREREIEI